MICFLLRKLRAAIRAWERVCKTLNKSSLKSTCLSRLPYFVHQGKAAFHETWNGRRQKTSTLRLFAESYVILCASCRLSKGWHMLFCLVQLRCCVFKSNSEKSLCFFIPYHFIQPFLSRLADWPILYIVSSWSWHDIGFFFVMIVIRSSPCFPIHLIFCSFSNCSCISPLQVHAPKSHIL